jgi:hypothetical protein
MATLSEFILQLSKHPHEMERYKADTTAYINESGLSSEQKASLTSGDPNQIRREITAEGHAIHPDSEYVIVVVAVNVTTRPKMAE